MATLRTLAVGAMLVAGAATLLIGAIPSSARADFTPDPDPRAWVADQYVSSIVPTEWGAYLGGNFTYLGPRTGSAAVLEPEDGGLSRPLADVATDFYGGPVWAIESDGAGGWYVGGNLKAVDGVDRGGLVHVLSDGTIDDSFPRVDGSVSELALSPDRRYLYVLAGGGAGAIDTASNDWTGFGLLYATSIAISPDGARVYVGTNKTESTGTGGIYVFDGGTQEQIGSSPLLAGNRIRALAATADTLYVDAAGSSPSGAADPGVMRLDRATGSVIWGPRYGDVKVNDMEVSRDGAKLYVENWDPGNHPALPALARLDTANGDLDDWDPSYPTSLWPHRIELSADGSKLISVGTIPTNAADPFRPEDSARGSFLRAFSTDDAATTVWEQVASGDSWALGVDQDTGEVGVGGNWASIGGVRRSGLAAVDQLGRPLPWHPTTFDRVYSISPNPDGNSVYVSGSKGFSAVLAELRTSDGEPTDWGNAIRMSDPPRLEVGPGGRIYFTSGSGLSQGTIERNVGAISPAGKLLPWGRRLDFFSGGQFEINPFRHSIYLSGSYRELDTAERRLLGPITELSLDTGQATAWTPQWSLSGLFPTDLELSPDGQLLYAGAIPDGGYPFTPSPHTLVALKTTDGELTTYDPQAWQGVGSLALTPGGHRLYMSGPIRTWGRALDQPRGVAGADRDVFAGTFTADGSITPWHPALPLPYIDRVGPVAVSPGGGSLWVSADLHRVGGRSFEQFAIFRDPQPDTALDTSPPPDEAPPTGAPVPQGSGSPSAPRAHKQKCKKRKRAKRGKRPRPSCRKHKHR